MDINPRIPLHFRPTIAPNQYREPKPVRKVPETELVGKRRLVAKAHKLAATRASKRKSNKSNRRRRRERRSEEQV